MKKKNKRIIIANYYFSGGGPLVLSQLCATLRELGYDAKLLLGCYPKYGETINFITKLKKNLKIFLILIFSQLGLFPQKLKRRIRSSITVEGIKFKYLPIFNKNRSIIIYPEIIWGNPLNAKMIVRWLLYHHRYYDQKNTYGSEDVFIAYRQIFNDIKLNPDKNYVTINHFNKNLYRQYNFGKREGTCYLIRKGRNRPDLPSEFSGPVFDDNMLDEDFVRILNQCEFCVSYDTQSFYNSIAAVCGCIPIVIMEPGKTEKDYLSENEKHYGVAWGNTKEQIEYAKSTRNLLLESLDYHDFNLKNGKQLVEILQSKFGPIRRIKKNK